MRHQWLALILIGLNVYGAQEARREVRLSVVGIQGLIEKGDLDAALRLIKEALEKHPDDAGILNLRGVVNARRDQLAAAREDFAEAVRIDPRLTPAWQNLGRACGQLKQGECALEAWQQVVRMKPGDRDAHLSLAEIYEEKAQFAESLQQLSLAKTENLVLRCLDLSGLGRVIEATAVAGRLAQRSDFSEADFGMMHGPIDQSKSAEVLTALVEGLDARGAAGLASLERLAVAYEESKRTDKARGTLERVAVMDPQNSSHLLELARLAEGARDREGALGYLAHARDLEPNNARIHFLFGAIAGEMNLPIEAKQSLDKALAMEPDNADYNYAMGSVILQTRDAGTASNYFAKYVKARPADPQGHYALGLAYFASGDYERAKQEMHQAKQDRDLAAAGDYYLGRMARLDGDLEEAKRELKEAVALRPKFSEPHTELGRIAMLSGEMDGAREELELAVRLKPESFQANEQLLVLYKRTHDGRAAAQEETLKKLDEERSKRAELMLRTLEMRP